MRTNSRATEVMALLVCIALSAPSTIWAQGSRYELTPRVFSLDLRMSGVYDTNVNHDEDKIESHGVLAGVDARLRSSGRRPFFTLGYRGRVRSFSGTDRWDRLEHKIEALIARQVGALTLETTGAIDFRGATEDRELGNQYTIRPRVALSLGSVRLRAYGAYRLRRFEPLEEFAGEGDPLPLDPADAIDVSEENTYIAGAEFRWKIGGGQSWEVGYRYEDSDSDNPSRRYYRHRYEAEYRAEFADRAALTLGLQYRPRRYPDLLVEIEDPDGETGEVVRKDVRWVPYTALAYSLPWGQEVELEYEYQRRTSNDPDEEFEAHRVTLSVRLPVVSRFRRTRSYD